MKYTTTLLLIFLTCLFVKGQGWEQFYGEGTPAGRAIEAVQLPDGDFLVLAETTGEGLSVIRTDEQGQEKWIRPLSGFSSTQTVFSTAGCSG